MSVPPHSYTLTGNLLAERTLEFAAWAPGKTQRAGRESFQAGGKGVNVSRMLARLGVPTTALCFTGGAPGAECAAWLDARHLAHRAFPSASATRTGVVIRTPGQPETTFLGADVPPSSDAVQACAGFLDAQPDGRLLAVCGSLPGWAETAYDPLRAALERWHRRGLLVADTYGPPLAWLVSLPLALVKINAVEFRALAGAAADAPVSTALAATAVRSPVRRWIVTDGPGPVWFGEGCTPPASLTPPPVREVSATGSGDVLLAGVMRALFYQHRSLPEAVAAALPFAAANAAHAGIATFDLPA
jgi:fructose-1-phosphate kinase PfkB-like protein